MTTVRTLPRLANASAQTNEPKSSSSKSFKPQNQTSQNSFQRNDSFPYSIPGYSQPTAIKYMKLKKNEQGFFSKLFNLA